jgi:arginine decarboxylase
MDSWNVERSRELYRVREWGSGYFDINEDGNVVVRPDRNGHELDLFELTRSLDYRGISAPILFRFDGIIEDRVRLLQTSFDDAIKAWGYQGLYRIAFPVKVNPLRHVVDTLRKSGHTRNIGLEVGSKPELLAVLALHEMPDTLLLCNGYKDAEYIELALTGRKIGRRSIIIIEQFYELQQIMDIAKQLDIEPELGIRMKPLTRGGGYWDKSAGDQAKFGLTTSELLAAIETLKANGCDHWVKLLHFHVGSQIPNINSVRRVLKEATRMYVEVARLCPSVCFMDVGGGLGIDYDGSKSNYESSMNYTMDEYADSVVGALFEACQRAGVPHPDIITESGRAVVAHHAVLVTEVIDVASAIPMRLEKRPISSSANELLVRLDELGLELTVKNLRETLNEILSIREEMFHQFISGQQSLEDRARGDVLYRHLCGRIVDMSRSLKNPPEEIQKIASDQRDTLFCNFSLFQSMLDSWAIDQLFPIMPIQQLKDEPEGRAIVADLTCDSDGTISRFIDSRDVRTDLPYNRGAFESSPYYLGVFLVGAYQEILGGLHNLFGDTNAVHVRIGADNQIDICEVVRGDTIREVLTYVEYDVADLEEMYRRSLERAIKQDRIKPDESARILRRYREALSGYTYLVK